MSTRFIIILLLVISPALAGAQSTSNSERLDREVDFGSGLYIAVLRHEDFIGSDVSVGGYHLSASFYDEGWIFSPVIRYMSYNSLIGEDGTSHNEFGLRGGYRIDLDKKQYSFLLGPSFIFGEAFGSKPNPRSTGLYDTRIYLDEDYRSVGLTSEFAWKQKIGNHFLAGITVPFSISSWYSIITPHISIGYRW